MEILETLINDYYAYIIIGLIVLTIIMFIILIINNIKISKLSRKYKKFMRGSKEKNIEELIFGLMGEVDKISEKSESIKSMYGMVDRRLDKCLQKVSIIRYKAFEDMGSAALSFSVALLDAEDDGIILTGIYGRNECTTYAKPIDKGIPKYDLSDEENQVLKDALRKKISDK